MKPTKLYDKIMQSMLSVVLVAGGATGNLFPSQQLYAQNQNPGLDYRLRQEQEHTPQYYQTGPRDIGVTVEKEIGNGSSYAPTIAVGDALPIESYILGENQASNDAVLQVARIIYDTTNENKDHDTFLNVEGTIQSGNEYRRVHFQRERFAGDTEFKDHTRHSYELDLEGTIRRSDVDAMQIRIEIEPNGNDTWRFGYTLQLYFSDGTVLEKRAEGIVLSEDDRTHERTF